MILWIIFNLDYGSNLLILFLCFPPHTHTKLYSILSTQHPGFLLKHKSSVQNPPWFFNSFRVKSRFFSLLAHLGMLLSPITSLTPLLPSHTLLLAHWSPFCSSNTSGVVPPQICVLAFPSPGNPVL